MTTSSKVHDIEIICRDGVWKVEPSKVKAKAGDSIHWNVVSSDATLLFPTRKLFWHQDFMIATDKGLVLNVGQDKEGEYRYAVFCHKENDFAEGNSSPIIIIEK